MLAYVTNLKELKKADVKERTESARTAGLPRPVAGTLGP